MTSNLDGLQPTNGLRPTSDDGLLLAMASNLLGLQPTSNGLQSSNLLNNYMANNRLVMGTNLKNCNQ